MRDKIWAASAHFYSEQLRQKWDSILIDGETIEQKYGLTLETCLRYKVGFAPAETLLWDVLRSEINGLSNDDLFAASGWGLIKYSTSGTMQVYNYFKNRVVFAYPKDEQIIYFSGRKTDLGHDEFFAKNKFLHLPLESARLTEKPIYLEAADEGPTVMVEQQAGALRLRQEGFAGIAIGGAIPTQVQCKILRKIPDLYYWPDVDQLAAEPEHYEDLTNGETKYHPEITAEEKLLRLISTLDDTGAKLVRYSAEFAKQFPKGDMNDWWKQTSVSRSTLLNHLRRAQDKIDTRIGLITKDTPLKTRAKRIDDLIPHLASLPEIEAEDRLKILRESAGLNNSQIAFISKRRKELRETSRTQDSPIAADDFSQAINFPVMEPGQCFRSGKLYYSIFKRIPARGDNGVATEDVPFVISSSREIFEYSALELLKNRFVILPEVMPELAKYPWSTDPAAPWSVPQFLKDAHGTAPETPKLFGDIRDYLEKYLYIENPYLYDFLAAFTIITYCVQIFGAMGLLCLTGTRSVGKSRVLDLITSICFDPLTSATQSDSFIFRATNSRKSTIFLDEAEFLASLSMGKGTPNERINMLNAAYRKGGYVGRSIGDTHKSNEFNIYTCYLIASQKQVHPTLASRAFALPMVKRPPDRFYPHWFPEKVAKQTDDIRNRCHYWALANAELIYHCYQEVLSGKYDSLYDKLGLRDRELEIWAAPIAIAMTCDKLVNNNLPDEPERVPSAETYTGKILVCADYMTKVKNEQISDSDQIAKMLIGLRQILIHGYVKSIPIPSAQFPDDYDGTGASGLFSTAELTKCLNSMIGLDHPEFPKPSGPNSLKALLTNRLKMILENDDAPRITPAGKKSRMQFVRLFEHRIAHWCKTYNVPDGAELDFDDDKQPDTSFDNDNQLTEDFQ